jgi:hypothetical protein
LPSLRPDGPPAINGKPPASPSPSCFAYLPAPLFKLALDRLRVPLHPQHTMHSTEPQFPSAAASGPRRRHASAAVGEGSPPPPPFSSLWVHQGLIKLNWLQVRVLGARGRRASSTPERRPSCRRCQAPPPLDPLRLRACPLHR